MKSKLLILRTILGFVLLFSVQNLYSQQSYLLLENNDTCLPPEPTANCTSNSIDILGAYLGLADGTPIDDAYLAANPNLTTNAYLFIDVSRNGNKFDLLLQFDSVEFDLANPLDPPVRTEREYRYLGSIQTSLYRVPNEFNNYIVNGEVNTLIGIENISLSWDNTDNGTVTCITGNYSACNGEIPDFIAVGPFATAASFDPISCNGDTTTIEIFTSGGTDPYFYSLFDNAAGIGTPISSNNTGIFNNIASGIYYYVAFDSSSPIKRSPETGLTEIDITEPGAVSGSAPLSSVCSGETTSITITGSGGTGDLTYTFNGNSITNNTGSATFTNVSAGLGQSYTITDTNGCIFNGTFDVTAVNLSVIATARDVSCPGETDGTITVQGSGGIAAPSAYILRDPNNDVIGIVSNPASNPNPQYTFTPENTGDPLGPGTYTIEFDQVVGANTCQATTTVTIGTTADTEDPIFSICPGDISVNNDPDSCGAAVTWTSPRVGDNCGIASLSGDFNPGDTFPVGTTIVTYTAVDESGNTATCSFNVVVTDNEVPTIACPQAIIVDNDADSCDAVVTFTVPFNDNCPGSSINQTAGLASGSAFPIGTTINTFVVTDAAGNTATCNFPVTVNDIQDPTISCPSDINLNVDAGNCSAVATFATPAGADNCGVASVTQTAGPASGSAFPVGTTTVTFEVTDTAGLTAECSFNVVVTDNEAPTIACPSDINLNVDAGNCSAVATFATPAGADNCGVASVTQTAGPASGSAFPVGTTTVTFEVTDTAGLTAECSFNVVVTDNEAPTIACPSDINLNVDAGNCSAVATFATPAGADNCGVASVTQTAGPTSGNAFPVGTTTVTFEVTDTAGLTAECSFNVVVTDNEAPTIACSQAIIVDNDADSCGAVVTFAVPFNDNCPGSTINQTAGLASGSAFPIGTTINTFVVTDAAGNTATCTFPVTVNDIQDPTLTCPADIAVGNDADSCDAVVTYDVPFADNCPGSSINQTAGLASGSTFPIGTTTNTFVVTDAAGNTATCSFDVTVNDIQDPTASNPATTIVECIEDVPAIDTEIVTDENDNCTAIVAFVSETSLSPDACGGSILRTYSVTDPSGNTINVTHTIIVDDTTEPILTGTPFSDNTDFNVCASDALTTVPAWTEANALVGYSDNCSTVSAQLTDTTLSGDDCGWAVTYTYSVFDACNNELANQSYSYSGSDSSAPVVTAPSNVTIECNEDQSPANTGNATAIDNCDNNTVITYVDQDCFGTQGSVNLSANAAGNTFDFDISQLPSNYTANDISSLSLNFTTNQAAGNAEFWLIAPSGQAVILVGPYCEKTDGNCGLTGDFDITFSSNSSLPTWNNTNATLTGDYQPNGSLTSDNPLAVVSAAVGTNVTLVQSFDDFTGSINGTWKLWGRKFSDEPVNGGAGVVNFNSICLTPALNECPNSEVFVRVWTATDACGNSSSANQIIVVEDTTAPTFNETLPSDVTVECDAVPTADTLTATDNCGSATVDFNEVRTDGSCPSSYTLARTWTATDECGLTTSYTQTITVQDTTAPTFVEALPADATVECDSVPAADTLTATDNCDASVTVVYNEVRTDSACDSEYSLARTWTVTDCAGNSTSHTQTITVEDNTAPTFVEALPADATVECDSVPAADTLTANDNCDASVTVVYNEVRTDSACDSEYSLARTWTVTDCAGNSTSHTQTITVEDNTAPTFVEALPADATVECDSVPAADTLTATDNCDASVTVVYNEVRTDSACDSEYSLARTWTVTDCAGNSTSHTQTITVEDNTAPTFVEALPADATVECDSVPAADTLTATDNCDASVSVVYNEVRTDSACDSEYSLARTWTVTDCAGNSTSHTQTITVEDNTAPTFVEALPADATVECDSVPAADTLTATDNCDASVTVVYNEVRTDSACDSEYSLARTWTVTDCAGNSTSHTQTITVEDNTAPTFVEALPADATVECDSVPAADTLTATDNCDASVTVVYNEVRTDSACDSEYSLARTWTVTDCAGNSTSHTQTITVEDNTAPTFVEALPADATVECDSVPAADTLTATDNCDASVSVVYNEVRTDSACDSEYSLARTWTVTDCAGNSTSHTQTITVEDNTAPTFVEALPADATVECDSVPAADTLTATDNCDASVTVNFNEVRTDGVCSSSYTLARTWTVTDCAGNSTSHTQTITVEDTTAPSITAAVDIIVECGVSDPNALQDWLASNGGATATDNCASVNDLVWSNNFNTQSVDVDCANGSIEVTFTVTDACGNSASTTSSYSIIDTIEPVLTIPANVTIECDEDSSTANTGVATATDDCSTPSVSFTDVVTSGNCPGNYIITRTWSTSDGCNTVTADQIITVQDTTDPVITIAASDQTVECDGQGNVNELNTWLTSYAGAMATDNCDTDLTWTNNFTSLSDGCGETGSAIVTFTATDDCGNTITTSAKFEIEDNNAPILTVPADVTAECSDDTSETALGVATATDGCDANPAISFNDVRTDGNCDGNYTITRTWTATDACGNSVSADQVISVQDTTAPVLTVPADVTAECSDDLSTAALGTATATDNCATTITIVSNDVRTDGNCDGNYTITRTWTATDECGNSVSNDQVITVQDTTAPVLTLPADVTAECSDDLSTAALGTATATDNCATTITIVSNDVRTDGNCDGNYTITRTWTATDECGNSVSNDQVITVQDTTAPVLTVPASVTAECSDDLSTAALGTATATDNCSATITIVSNDVRTDGNCDGNYTITRTWTATDECGNSVSADQVISVQDTTAPVLTVPADVTSECSDDLSTAALGTATATDNCATTITIVSNDVRTDGNCDGNYTITRTWTATDECGNSVSADQVITVQDTTAPVLTVPADVTAECSDDLSTAALGTATATDNCATTITIVSNDVRTDGNCDGNYTITRTWTATDECGNSVSADQVISVQDITAPVLTVPSDITVDCEDDTSNVALGNATATDNCDTNPDITFNDIITNGNCAGNYTITRTWTAIDACGNSVSTDQLITVQDTTAPVITLPADVTLECTDNSDPTNTGFAMVTDNCSAGSVDYSDVITNGDCAGNYIITRTWTAMDDCGNEISADQVITVQDTTAPVLTVPANVTGECSDDVSVDALGTATATDNCDANPAITFNDVITNGDCAGNYTITRTWTATDECGNPTSADQVITVQDTTAPVLTVPANVTAECSDDVSIDALGTATATDNCDANPAITFTDVITDGDCAGNYTITRTWTATDECGNPTSADQVITVQDTTAPVLTVPADATVECTDDVSVDALGSATAIDNCDANPAITFTDVITDGDCAGNYTITRTWNATDECGNPTSADQVITVQDTTAPTLVEGTVFESNISVTCQEIPVAPSLSFEDNCSSNITVEFTENSSQGNGSGDYEIVRTWTVSDGCNQETFTQVVSVSTNLITVTDGDRCYDNGIITLSDFISGDENLNGTWSVVVGDVTLNGDEFVPTIDMVGETLTFEYAIADGPCASSVEVDVFINDDCIVLPQPPCGRENVEISKTVTPNNDQYNQFFEVTGVEDCGYEIQLQIFNRWGAIIYKDNNYQNNWSGQAHSSSVGNSNFVPTGTYYYIINLRNSGFAPFSGPIYVATK